MTSRQTFPVGLQPTSPITPAQKPDSGGGNAPGPHSLAQTISTIAGETYVLEFDYRDDNGTTNQQLQVAVDGSSNLLTTEQILTDINDTTWVRYRFEFTADSTSATLTFTRHFGRRGFAECRKWRSRWASR